MKVHEYQAKALLAPFDVPLPQGKVLTSPEELPEILSGLKLPVVVKAQIHAGGRGKGGGVALAKTADEARQAVDRILGMTLVTHQTGPAGRLVRRVLVEEATAIDRELYLGLVVDRSRARECVVVMASAAGGMEIEEVAARAPEQIIRCAIHPAAGFSPFQANKLAWGLGIGADKALSRSFAKLLSGLYRFFMEQDASLVEINPLVITQSGELLAVDAKVNLDDDGLSRHPALRGLRDPDEEDPLEVVARDTGVNYIKLDGNVGCMVNGAGLAMTTMDLIKMAGGEPANFLDVGGGASPEQIEKAFRILLSDPNVKAILVNIFGGILRCDRVATGIVQAAQKVELTLPMVVRLQGTNVEEGRRILRESSLTFTVADGLYEAAEKAVAFLQ